MNLDVREFTTAKSELTDIGQYRRCLSYTRAGEASLWIKAMTAEAGGCISQVNSNIQDGLLAVDKL